MKGRRALHNEAVLPSAAKHAGGGEVSFRKTSPVTELILNVKKKFIVST